MLVYDHDIKNTKNPQIAKINNISEGKVLFMSLGDTRLVYIIWNPIWFYLGGCENVLQGAASAQISLTSKWIISFFMRLNPDFRVQNFLSFYFLWTNII